VAPRGAALLLSLGFRPTWLDPDRAWRLAAISAMAMADAAEEVARLPAASIRLKWPNDLVFEAAGTSSDGSGRKLAGLLGETDGLGSRDPRAVIGLGINADWPASQFPADLAGSMTSLRETAQDRPIDMARLLGAFIARLEPRVDALRGDRFDIAGWEDRQLTTGRLVRLERPGGAETIKAIGVDGTTGALIVEDDAEPGGTRRVLVGEISHVRLATTAGSVV
jgi:BirA family biotin operon repressor/biotin-[acetyl-CoA-carboxylase] ligase